MRISQPRGQPRNNLANLGSCELGRGTNQLLILRVAPGLAPAGGFDGQAFAAVAAEVGSGGLVSAGSVDDVHPHVGVGMRPMSFAPLRERGDNRECIGPGIGQDVLVAGTSLVLIGHASSQAATPS